MSLLIFKYVRFICDSIYIYLLRVYFDFITQKFVFAIFIYLFIYRYTKEQYSMRL